MGYADGVREAPEVVSVTRYDERRAQSGLNFYTSGHATEAYLIDMRGELVHRWSYDYRKLWPDHDVPADARGRHAWRRAHLFDDGSILAIHAGIGMIKLDRDSNLLWEYPGRAHHDVHVSADGTLWVLTREVRLIPRIDPNVPCVEDFIVALDADGRELKRVSVLECLENGRERRLLDRMDVHKNLLHTNSIELLDGRIADRVPEFAAGNVLISMRAVNAIAVVNGSCGS